MASRAWIGWAAAVGALVACAPGGLSDPNEQSGESETGPDESGPDEAETGEPEPSACIDPDAAPLCTWTESEQSVEWEPLPIIPAPLSGLECVHGQQPKLAIDGDSLLIAYTDQLCDDRRSSGRLVIGTDTLGEWQTVLTSAYYPYPDHLEVAPDGTVRLMERHGSVVERRDGEWTRWAPPNDDAAWILSDPNSGADHVLFRDRRVGRHQQQVSTIEADIECEENWSPNHRVASNADFAISATGVPHIAYFGQIATPAQIGLFHSYRRDGTWAIERLECFDNFDSLYRRPELELDADGHVHVCTQPIPGEPEEVVYFTNKAGTWTSTVMQASSTLCEIEVDLAGRVHLVTGLNYRVLDGDTWSTVWTFEESAAAGLAVSPEGVVYILRHGLELLTNESGEWVERQVGIGYVP